MRRKLGAWIALLNVPRLGADAGAPRFACRAAGRELHGDDSMTAPAPPFSDNKRQALAMLVKSGSNGVTTTLLAMQGFPAVLIAELVNRGLATITPTTVRAGGKRIEVSKVRITDAGRRALAQ